MRPHPGMILGLLVAVGIAGLLALLAITFGGGA